MFCLMICMIYWTYDGLFAELLLFIPLGGIGSPCWIGFLEPWSTVVEPAGVSQRSRKNGCLFQMMNLLDGLGNDLGVPPF